MWRVLRRYGDRIAVVDCEDQGPATKLLGLLDHTARGGVLSAADKIIVVDDDIIYSDTMIYRHELCHDFYQCDVSIIDERLVQRWIPLRFHRREADLPRFGRTHDGVRLARLWIAIRPTFRPAAVSRRRDRRHARGLFSR